MSLIGCCVDRLIDPRTKQTVAAIGWIQEKKEFPRKFWVSIETSPVEFFNKEEAAKFYYNHSLVRLMAAISANGTNGHNNHNKRRPPTRGHKRA